MELWLLPIRFHTSSAFFSMARTVVAEPSSPRTMSCQLVTVSEAFPWLQSEFRLEMSTAR